MNEQTNSAPDQRRDRIASLNDTLRTGLYNPGDNKIVMTSGIADMIGDVSVFRNFRKRAELLRIVIGFEDFSEANNPQGERDFGAFDWLDTRCYWKIDCYDRAMSGGSPDPANPDVTCRVLTILRADEY